MITRPSRTAAVQHHHERHDAHDRSEHVAGVGDRAQEAECSMEKVRDVGDQLADRGQTQREGEHPAERPMARFAPLRCQGHGERGGNGCHCAGDIFKEEPVVARVEVLQQGCGRRDRHSDRYRGKARSVEVARGHGGGANLRSAAEVGAMAACGQPPRGGEIHAARPFRDEPGTAASGCVVGFIVCRPSGGTAAACRLSAPACGLRAGSPR